MRSPTSSCARSTTTCTTSSRPRGPSGWRHARPCSNPKYTAALREQGATAAEIIAETFRNTYGWDVMQPTMIDEEIWNKYHEVYIQDKHGLEIEAFFREKNPYALQEMTTVMLETARKGYWNPGDQVLRGIAELHVRLIDESDAGCSGFVCDNGKLRDMIRSTLDDARRQAYLGKIEAVRVASGPEQETAQGITLEEQKDTAPTPDGQAQADRTVTRWATGIAIAAIFAVIVLLAIRKRKPQA